MLRSPQTAKDAPYAARGTESMDGLTLISGGTTGPSGGLRAKEPPAMVDDQRVVLDLRQAGPSRGIELLSRDFFDF